MSPTSKPMAKPMKSSSLVVWTCVVKRSGPSEAFMGDTNIAGSLLPCWVTLLPSAATFQVDEPT